MEINEVYFNNLKQLLEMFQQTERSFQLFYNRVYGNTLFKDNDELIERDVVETFLSNAIGAQAILNKRIESLEKRLTPANTN